MSKYYVTSSGGFYQGRIDTYPERRTEYIPEHFKSQKGPNKFVLAFFFLLSLSVFSYLIFNSIDSSAPTLVEQSESRTINIDKKDTGYFSSLMKSVSHMRDQLFGSGDVTFTARKKIKRKKGYTKKWKRILIYTKLFGASEWNHLPRSVLSSIMKKCKCKIQTCKVTYSKRWFKKSDGVIFHAADMPNIDLLRQLRSQPGAMRQRWLYFSSESPSNVPEPTILNNYFNLTMTVKWESDIWLPYGRFVPLEAHDQRPLLNKNYAKDKEPGAAWIVSHCGTTRDEYVLKLQEEYPVSVGGSCGPMFKYQMLNGRDYDGEIRKRFKFYLAFENGFCRNYITEKYWDRAINNSVVPIVMGGGPYNHGQYGAIPGSYIDVNDFASVTDLASYLHYLDKNDTAYNEFFLWKQKYKRYKAHYGDWPHPCTFLCDLCDILHNLDYPEKSYNLKKFLDVEKNCGGRDQAIRAILAHSEYLYDKV